MAPPGKRAQALDLGTQEFWQSSMLLQGRESHFQRTVIGPRRQCLAWRSLQSSSGCAL